MDGLVTRHSWWRRGLSLALVLLLAACQAARPSATPTALPLPTAQVQRHTATPSLTPSPEPSPTTPCLAAQALRPTEARVRGPLQSEQVVTWQIQNTGACPWEPPLTLAPQGQNPFAGQATLEPASVPPGGTLTVRLHIRLPATPGTYAGNWRVRTGQGQEVPLTLRLHGEAIPPTPTPTATPGPPLFVQRQVDLTSGKSVNFDNGTVDAAFNFNGPQDYGLGHEGDFVFFYRIYYWPPDFADCYHAPYTSKNALLNPVPGETYCFTTNEGRVGALRVEGLYYDDQGKAHLVLTYLTWAAKRR